eukprot:GEMP01010979.1.p1 GENE.GEMP01010979.1~~GEMP01010979.1.p1  ORF type:complete len:684 (+),score=133.06 GEMP01010979.1:244-2052(+)
MWEKVKGHLVEDRYLVLEAISTSGHSIFTRCADRFLNREVVIKFLMDDHRQITRDFMYEMTILQYLTEVPQVMNVVHFTGSGASWPFGILELLDGETLVTTFNSIIQGERGPMSMLEAAEIADDLLSGVDKCHAMEVLNFNLQPDTIWLHPPLRGCRVKIIDWELAEILDPPGINPDFTKEFRNHRDHTMACKLSHVKIFRKSNDDEGNLRNDSEEIEVPFPDLLIENFGTLYYMSPERLYFFLKMTGRDPERSQWEIGNNKEKDQQEAASFVPLYLSSGLKIEATDNAASILREKVTEPLFVQTRKPCALTPHGWWFAVEIQKVIVTNIRAGEFTTPGAGRFVLGLTRSTGERSHLSKKREAPASLDGFYFVFPSDVGEFAPNILATCNGEQVEFPQTAKIPNLRKRDIVGLLLSFDGVLSFYLNSEKLYSQTVSNSVQVLASDFYGFADVRGVIKAIWVPELSSWKDTEDLQHSCAQKELNDMYSHILAAAETALNPASDVYSCGLVLAQCFSGGYKVEPSLAFQTFQSALVRWIKNGNPPVQSEYGLLWALNYFVYHKEDNLSHIENASLRLVLAKATKRTRYSPKLRNAPDTRDTRLA